MEDSTSMIIPMAVDGDITRAVRRAARVLTGGGVILYPTDTIYGLGCRATDGEAVGRIYAMKGRPPSMPSLILVGSAAMVERFVAGIPPVARTLMDRFLPGPLTLLFRSTGTVPGALTAGTGRIGIRFPAHEFCARLAERCDDAIVSTSANVSGMPPPAEPADIFRQFASSVDLVVNAGKLVSRPSTVADISGGVLVVLREGVISGGILASALVPVP